MIAGSLANTSIAAPHAYLADACLACHQETEPIQEPLPSSHGEHRRDASGSCVRCHGETEVDLIFEDEGTGLPATYEQVVANARAAMAARLHARGDQARERARVATLLDWLEADGSRGVHNPALVRELSHAAH